MPPAVLGGYGSLADYNSPGSSQAAVVRESCCNMLYLRTGLELMTRSADEAGGLAQMAEHSGVFLGT